MDTSNDDEGLKKQEVDEIGAVVHPTTSTTNSFTKIQIEDDIHQVDVRVLMLNELGNLGSRGRSASGGRGGAKALESEVEGVSNDNQPDEIKQKIITAKTRSSLKSSSLKRPPPSPPPSPCQQSFASKTPPPISFSSSPEEEIENLQEKQSLQVSLKMMEETIRKCRKEFDKKKKKMLTKHQSLDQTMKKPFTTPISVLFQAKSEAPKSLFHQSPSQKSIYAPLSTSFNALPPTAIRTEKVAFV